MYPTLWLLLITKPKKGASERTSERASESTSVRASESTSVLRASAFASDRCFAVLYFALDLLLTHFCLSCVSRGCF